MLARLAFRDSDAGEVIQNHVLPGNLDGHRIHVDGDNLRCWDEEGSSNRQDSRTSAHIQEAAAFPISLDGFQAQPGSLMSARAESHSGVNLDEGSAANQAGALI